MMDRATLLGFASFLNGLLSTLSQDHATQLGTHIVTTLVDKLGPSFIAGELDKYAAASAAIDELEDLKFGKGQ